MNTMIRGFTGHSLCDWPGKMSAVVFLGGCNFRCPTCHNWQLATDPSSMESLSDAYVIEILQARKSWLDGLVVSGGEPTLASGLLAFLQKIKEIGLPVNLHTNGSRPGVVKELFERNLVEVFSVDVKGPWSKYPQLSGNCITARRAERNLRELFDLAERHSTRFHFRTTLVPDLHCEDVEQCHAYLPKGMNLKIQEYRVPDQLKA